MHTHPDGQQIADFVCIMYALVCLPVRLLCQVSDALRAKDYRTANKEKSAVEAEQRQLRAQRERSKTQFEPTFFRCASTHKPPSSIKRHQTSPSRVPLSISKSLSRTLLTPRPHHHATLRLQGREGPLDAEKKCNIYLPPKGHASLGGGGGWEKW